MDFIVFEEPEMTIISCHVEGNGTDELRKHLMVEIRSASDLNKIESVFPLPISNFFQVKGLSKGRHLLKLQSGLPSSSLKFESDLIEVDLEKNVQIHVGPLRYWIEDQLKQVSSFVSTLSIFVCLCFSKFAINYFLFSSVAVAYIFLILISCTLQELTPAPVFPLIVAFLVVALFLSMPR